MSLLCFDTSIICRFSLLSFYVLSYTGYLMCYITPLTIFNDVPPSLEQYHSKLKVKVKLYVKSVCRARNANNSYTCIM